MKLTYLTWFWKDCACTLWFVLLLHHSQTVNCQKVSPIMQEDFLSVQLSVNTSAIIHETDFKFLSVTLPCNLFFKKWLDTTHKLSSLRVKALASYLGAAYLRFGGTCADYIEFSPCDLDRPVEQVICNTKQSSVYLFKPSDWDFLYSFTASVKWNLIFDVNVLIRNYLNQWDTSNFKELLGYISERNNTNVTFQLGNEPNSFFKLTNLTVTGIQLAADYTRMKQLLVSSRLFSQAPLIGAEITSPDYNHDLLSKDPGYYMIDFLKAIPTGILSAFTWHQYYMPPTSSIVQFTNSTLFDRLSRQAFLVQKYVRKYSSLGDIPLWLSETSSAYGSGVPHMSDRFVASFMWLDKLGVMAKSHDVVIRQAFIGGHYSLLNKTWDPTPDYWVSVVFKRHVGTKVFQVRSNSSDARFYAHCTHPASEHYRQGSLTVYGMNLNDKLFADISLDVELYKNGTPFIAYVFTAPDDNVLSRSVDINGRAPYLGDDYLIHGLTPLMVNSVSLQALSLGIFVLPDANVTAC